MLPSTFKTFCAICTVDSSRRESLESKFAIVTKDLLGRQLLAASEVRRSRLWLDGRVTGSRSPLYIQLEEII
jgi:hypothetical protein